MASDSKTQAKEKEKAELRKAFTSSGKPIEVVYGPEHLAGWSPEEKLGEPGSYPYTRGIYPTMYRGKMWTMRLYAGMGSAEDTNRRFRFLLENGQTGLSVALDLPTQLGMDSDSEEAEDDVGRVGVAIDTLLDMESLFDSIPLDQVSTSFTINATAPILLAMYVAVGEKQGVAPALLRGTVQNDILKEYIARGLWIFPPEASMRLVADVVEYCSREIPKWNAISVSSTHIANTGAFGAQTAAFPILNALCYVDEVRGRGIDVDSFGRNLSFHMPVLGTEPFRFFEAIARFRAARRIWARLMRDQYGAREANTMRMRFSTGGGGVGLTAREPLNNISRLTMYSMASVMAGAQSQNLAAYDEAFAIPTELSARTSLRIQQLIAYESGVADTVDPLAGSYFVEHLTDQQEEEILAIMEEVRREGGMIQAIKSGSIQRKLTRQAYEHEWRIQTGEVVKVGVNRFTSDEQEEEVEMHEYDPSTRVRQLERLAAARARRDEGAVKAVLAKVADAARQPDVNMMPVLIEAVKTYATVGEITQAMVDVFGRFSEPQSV